MQPQDSSERREQRRCFCSPSGRFREWHVHYCHTGACLPSAMALGRYICPTQVSTVFHPYPTVSLFLSPLQDLPAVYVVRHPSPSQPSPFTHTQAQDIHHGRFSSNFLDLQRGTGRFDSCPRCLVASFSLFSSSLFQPHPLRG